MIERLAEGLPALPGDPEASLADIASVLDASVSPARPLYAAYIGSTGLEAGVLAGALANAYDVNLAAAAGAAELLENQTLRWVAEFVGYPVQDGAFTSGGMTSNLTALMAAREHALPDARYTGVSGRAAAVYCSEESHHSVARAVEVIGLGSQALRRIPIDAERRMRVDALREALVADRSAGVIPVAVVATSGTTLTGAIDPISEIADVCAEHGVWMHVDGAYGGPGAGVPSLAHRFRGIERADSLTIDAHKWLGVQKSCSLVMLSRQGPLEQAFAHDERYMLHAGVAANGVDRTLEYSRPVRSLKLWLAFKIYGADMMRRWIEMTAESRPDAGARPCGEPARSSCSTNRSSRSCASATLPTAIWTNTTCGSPRDHGRRPHLSGAGAGRRNDLPARLLHELPHQRRTGRRAPAGDRGARRDRLTLTGRPRTPRHSGSSRRPDRAWAQARPDRVPAHPRPR